MEYICFPWAKVCSVRINVSCYLFPMTVQFVHFQSGCSKARTGAAADAGSGAVGTWQHWWQSQEICRYLVLLSNKMHAKCACRACRAYIRNICNMQKRISIIIMDRGTGKRHPQAVQIADTWMKLGGLRNNLKCIRFIWNLFTILCYLFSFGDFIYKLFIYSFSVVASDTTHKQPFDSRATQTKVNEARQEGKQVGGVRERERKQRRARAVTGDGSVAERQSTGQTLDTAATLPVDEAADGSELWPVCVCLANCNYAHGRREAQLEHEHEHDERRQSRRF